MQETKPEIFTPSRKPGESGNVLFLILIAVVLFAALSFAVTMTSRSGGDVNQDKINLAAAQITQSGVDVDTAILRLRVARNIPDAEISFETDMLDNYENPACIKNDCRVFLPDGGKISYQKPHQEWLDHHFSSEAYFGEWLYTGTACIPGLGAGHDTSCGGDTDQLELIAILPYLHKDICITLNKKLGVKLINNQPPQLIGSGWAGGDARFTGTYENGEPILDSGYALYGQAEGCFEGNGTPPAGSYHYYRSIVSR